MNDRNGSHAMRGLMLATASLAAAISHAATGGAAIAAGQGRISRAGVLTTITQDSADLTIAWKGLHLASQETLVIRQPSADAVALIAIQDEKPTELLGHIRANGQVWLINRHGIVFMRGSRVDAGGVLASTLDIQGTTDRGVTFTGAGGGRLVNHGHVAAADGGYVALLGNDVANRGEIIAENGGVAAVAGSAVTLSFAQHGLAGLRRAEAAAHYRAGNAALMRADGGHVFMLADDVENSGLIRARTLDGHQGRISLQGDMAKGHAIIGGTLDASAGAGGAGGVIETDAAHLQVADAAHITTAAASGYGTWRVDPQDYTVAPSGGDITGAALSANLATTNVVLQSSAGSKAGSGNININDAVTWSANTTLTLTASNNVNVNGLITASGKTAGLVMNPNTANGKEQPSGTGSYVLGRGVKITLSGTTPSLSIAGTTYVVVNTLGAAGDAVTPPAVPTLQGMAQANNLNTGFALGADIDATATSGWNVTGGVAAGFTPIGNGQTDIGNGTSFAGNFQGLGHTITNLTINLPATLFVGLFGDTTGSIQDVGLVGGSVTGQGLVGMLAGCTQGNIANSYATGNVTGTSNGQIGGLAGCTGPGSVSNSHATGNVTGNFSVGGLVGSNGDTISDSYATGNVYGSYKSVGGLVGEQAGYIVNSYATGNVSGGTVTDPSYPSRFFGGLAGLNDGGSIVNSHATGTITTGAFDVGGLVGANQTAIKGSYATGNVTGGGSTGGLVGQNAYASSGNASISDSYALGNVSGTCAAYGGVGGLVGWHGPSATVTGSYAAGAVANPSTTAQCMGGFIGVSYASVGQISNGYWSSSANPSLQGVGGGSITAGTTGLTTAQMRSVAKLPAFTFSATPGASGWVIVDVDGSLNNAGKAAGATLPMRAAEYSTTIDNAHQLQLMAMDMSAHYSLTSDLDLSGTGNDVWMGAAFVPFGISGDGFSGNFDGENHRIANFGFTWSNTGDGIALFARTAGGAVIRNVRMANSYVVARNAEYVGSLVGWNKGMVDHSCAKGIVWGSHAAGVLVGYNNGGNIANSCSLGAVKGDVYIGGLVGVNAGLVSSSYSAAGVLSDAEHAGGLVGFNTGPVSNSYATGSVTSKYQNAGGLAGINGSSITNSYAVGAVKGSSQSGGLVGINAAGTTSGSFWNTGTSGQSGSSGGAGMNTANMQNEANFTSATPANGNHNPGWNFSAVWTMPAAGYPQLQSVSAAP